MPRRISHIILSIALLIATSGMTICSHYCGESLKSLKSATDSSSCCDKKTGCCHDEISTFRLDYDFEFSEHKTDFTQIGKLIPRPFVFAEEYLPVNATSTSYFKGPLPPNTQELLSRIQVYIL